MGYAAYLQALLEPLGVYRFTESGGSGAELTAAGVALDGCGEALELAEREALLATAEDEGLRWWEALFAHAPAAETAAARREAIAALARIGADSFTLSAINDTICGCGIRALALERGEERIRVIFPQTVGEPADYERIQRIILDILPAHLEVEFYLRFITWAECEERGYTWAMLESEGHTFRSFERNVLL